MIVFKLMCKQLQIQSINSLHKRIYSFFLADNAYAVIDAGTDKVIFFHHTAGKDAGFDLFAFSIADSKTYSWMSLFFMNYFIDLYLLKKIYMPYYVNLIKYSCILMRKNNKNTLIFTRISAILYLVPLRRVDYV